ncbi:MAG: hypothetical protein ACTS9Y_00900 [Methylophilus sp.]|uniref:hypothetical protein n=1 Tax=Methylophilus sp. TaxID=29541 RepID=UPI003F9FAC51
MIFHILEKQNTGSTVVSYWAIGINDQQQVEVRTSPNNDLVFSVKSILDLNGKTPAFFMKSEIVIKNREGFTVYGEEKYDIDESGAITAMITNAQTGALFSKPIIFMTGHAAKDFDFSLFTAPHVSVLFGGRLAVEKESTKTTVTYNHDLSEYEFSIVFRVIQTTDCFKVDSSLKHNHPPMAGLLMLYLDSILRDNNNGSVKFADADSSNMEINRAYKPSEVKNFNFMDMPDFRDYMEELGLIKQLFNFKPKSNSLAHAVSF